VKVGKGKQHVMQDRSILVTCEPRKQAEHMAAPTNAAPVQESPCQLGANGMDPALAARWTLERQLR
jgi:hypothetical protein